MSYIIGTACLDFDFHAGTPSGFFGNLSGKTKQIIMFEIKFVSHFNCCFVKMFYKKVSILVAVTVSGEYRTFLERKKPQSSVCSTSYCTGHQSNFITNWKSIWLKS
jgi:hypothetical protein